MATKKNLTSLGAIGGATPVCTGLRKISFGTARFYILQFFRERAVLIPVPARMYVNWGFLNNGTDNNEHEHDRADQYP